MFSIDAKSKGRSNVDTSRDIFLRHEHIVAGNLSGLKGVDFAALGCTFERCDFRRMRPSHITLASGMEPSRYVECKFDESKFKRIILGEARFERCSFANVDVTGLFSHAAEFMDCIFSGVLRASVFFGRVSGGYDHIRRAVNEFRGNDFSAAQFIDVDFRCGIDLPLQRLPTGDNYLYLANAAERLAALRRRYLQVASSERRREVFQFLEGTEDKVRDGQRDLFLCKDSWPVLSKDTLSTVWQELSQV